MSTGSRTALAARTAAGGDGGGGAIRLVAPAKINLGLEIVGRRPDGYHDLRTILQTLDLADEVEIAWRPGGDGVELQVTDELPAVTAPAGPVAERPLPVPVDGTNLAWRAADAFRTALGEPPLGPAGESPLVTLRVTKRIPVGAGLGGGSADAAAVLLGLNLLRGRPLGAGALFELAASLGADVPFALAGGICHASGRGERLRRLPALPPLSIVVVAPALPVATQWAYSAWDAEALTGSSGSASILEFAIRQGSLSLIAGALWNDLEPVVGRRYGVVRRIREDLLAQGVLGARMSGSGSAVFALLVDGHGAVLHTTAAMRNLGHPVIVCRPSSVGCRPSNA